MDTGLTIAVATGKPVRVRITADSDREEEAALALYSRLKPALQMINSLLSAEPVQAPRDQDPQGTRG